MSLFKHHPDGLIIIDDFMEPLAEFLIDEPTYVLPSGVIGREYIPGRYNNLLTGDSVIPQPFPWTEGDGYIAKKEQYRSAYAQRHLPPPPTPQELADVAALADVQTQWHAAALHNKTPQEIRTAMQNAIDGWTSLAQAKADLRAWLPMLTAGLAWTVFRDQQRD